MMMRRIGKVEKNSIWRGKDGLLEARKQAGAVVQEARRGGPSEETVRPSVCRRCMLAAAGCLTDPIEHDDLALRDMAVIVVQRQVVLSVSFGNGTTRAIAQSSGEAGLTRPPLISRGYPCPCQPVIGISSAAPLSLVKVCQLRLHPLAGMLTTSIPSLIPRNRDLALSQLLHIIDIAPPSPGQRVASCHSGSLCPISRLLQRKGGGGVEPSSLTAMFATFHDEEPHILLSDIS
ncbi:hypothetical protein An09g04560 [Aspergillus niger]|uniref:Uncharacterized protein n=2 Tax=Aspergillus niger TaxID=5061 RepID=A2QU67_ASPNC|nr:hypothetical protein An09g04560 [Aspergillus niger]CAK40310.1 hypothetical protein An09g04560 [Aspergillus niger]